VDRRAFLTSGVAAGAWLAAGPRAAAAGVVAEIDRALADSARSLIAAQAPDGAWRSSTYGLLKDGLSLTPPVLKALAFGPEVPGLAAARRRGAAYLIGRVRADGTIDDGPPGVLYPAYTAALAAIALDRIAEPGARAARDAWLRDLRRRQLAEPLGWGPSDPAYGGWGYTSGPPRRPAGADAPPADANLSATLFAVGALRLAGAEADDPAIRAASAFVRRCQNFPEDGRVADPSFDDGGFLFSPTDPGRNKAGIAGVDRRGRVRFASYGSMTADGLRALLRCGLPPDSPRVLAARRWLERTFSTAHNPGRFEPIREVERDASFFYYAWSLAHAFRALGLARIDGGRTSWGDALARALIRRQRPDGTWSNAFTATKEDDPLVATPMAAGALGSCRLMLAT